MNLFIRQMQKSFSHKVGKNVYRFCFLIVPLCLILLTGCVKIKSASPVSASGFYFDTVISVTLYQGGSEELLDECMELAQHYENLLSPHVEGSDLWNLNHSFGQAVTVDEDTLRLLQIALEYARLSDGVVDPTIGGLSMLWNFGSDNQEIIPKQQMIDEALSHVDYQSVMIDGNQITLTDPDARLELGFIAKGYIGDKLKEYLISQGVTSALINLGGNVVALGHKPDGTPFRIGIRDPFEGHGSTALTLDITDKSVVSSGNYERYFEKDGKLYHHILSTDTGYPAESGLSQVTILTSDSVDGDALSTLCFILGYEKAVSFLENFPEVQAIFIAEDGNISYVNF